MEASQTGNGQIPLVLEFEGRPHLHMVAPDWQEVAAAIGNWLDDVLDTPEPATQAAS